MSRVLALSLRNASGKDISSYKVGHSWNGHIDALKGQDLANEATSGSIEITSGYTQFDHYNVVVNYADGDEFNTKFTCNSSSGQDAVQIVMLDDGTCNCRYFENGADVDGCDHKG